MSNLHAESDPQRAPVAAVLDELSSTDADVRGAAADRIVDAGYFAIERVARHAASLGAESWQAFADAVLRRTWTPSPVGALVAAAHTAPEAHRRRLIELARRLDPEAGRIPTPQQIEAIVRCELLEKRVLDDWPGGAVVNIGHAAMPTVLKLLEGKSGAVDPDRADSVLSVIAQPEDIPALRRLLSEGKTYVAGALGRLDALGYTEALDALLAAVRSGRFDHRIAVAMRRASNRGEAARAVRGWVARRGLTLTGKDQVEVAGLFMAFKSQADIPLLEAWSSSSRNSDTVVALGFALAKLGSLKGIDILVRVVEEKKVGAPVPQKAGRISATGFDEGDRLWALRSLDAVAVQLSNSGDGSPGARPKRGPWHGTTYSELDRIAAEVRAWWEASREKLQFDGEAGEWRLKSD